jgi:mono/diheme cytochrome c family protein
MKMKYLLPSTVLAIGGVLLLVGNTPKATIKTQTPVQRGEYLVKFGDCSACHTPLKFGPNGPEPDLTRFLSGHPADTKLPPPELKPGPWFAATAGMTAWTGPWGISYAANLTPDANTGLGIWTEDMFIRTMRTGKHMGAGRAILPPMPWQASATLSDEDLKAVFAYLRSLPAIQNRVPDPLGPDGQPIFGE